uniref:Alpha-tocopherol transfer protein-like n=1 Tax=Lygus hesperus TaxID=30085 RepID=A0A0A9YIW8_LYGHE
MEDELRVVEMGEYKLRFENDAEIGEWFAEKARNELRETPELREEALRQLIDMIDSRDDMNRTYLPDEYLLGFLRVCKFYPESAFKRLHTSLVFKEKYPKYCENLRPLEEKNVFASNVFTVLPYRDQHGRRILLIEAGCRWSPKAVSLVELVRGVMMVVEAALLEPHTQICGATIVIDMIGLPMSHVWQFSPGFAKMLLDWVQEVVPCRVKAVHIVNQPYIFNMVFNIFKPFIGEKLRNRIFFHGTDHASLCAHIEPKFLPTQYGGEMNLQTVYGENLHKVLGRYDDRFEEVNNRQLVDVKKKSRK